MTKIVAAILFALMSASTEFEVSQSPQTGRDALREATGSAVIGGIVTADDGSGRPLRTAAVRLSGEALTTARQTFTGADGRFVFTNLPAGQYTVTAQRSGYMPMSYGARRPNGPGALIALAEGQRMIDIALRLTRFGSISGTIYDQNGEPAAGISVEALRYTMRTGRRSLSSVYGRPAFTDDRGVYTLGGLEPGEYYVAAGPSPDSGMADLRVLTEDDVDRVLKASSSATAGTATDALSSVAGARVNFAPVFYPGSVDLAGASSIALKLGEERTGVDVRLQLVPTARLEGTVMGLDGQPVAGVQVVATIVTEAFSLDLFRAGSLGTQQTDRQGRFAYSALGPGRYVVAARSAAAPAAWAATDVTMSGSDQSVAMTLQPSMSLTGRVTFDGTQLKPPSPLTTVRLSLTAVDGGAVAMAVAPTYAAADGTFGFTGVVPGTYRLTATVPPAASGWALRAALVDGADTLDRGFEVRPGRQIDGVTIAFTDRPTQLAGTLHAGSANLASDYFIIVFAADRSLWGPGSRRTIMVRPSNTGTYSVRNLPPGEYFLAAVADVDQNAWFDPAFLEPLVSAALRFTLAESERKTQDLRVGDR
jgi:hypothetical protein